MDKAEASINVKDVTICINLLCVYTAFLWCMYKATFGSKC